MKSICYVLSYYSPDYVRTRTILKALSQIDSIMVYECRNTTKGILRYVQTLTKLLFIRIIKNPDCYILGFRGLEYYWLVRLIVIGKPIIFDHMMSPYDSLVNERRLIKKNTWLDKLIFFYEKMVLKSSKMVLTDTNVHKNYFRELFKIEAGKIFAVPVGTDEEVFMPVTVPLIKNSKKSSFKILFYGSFLPLHGIEIILQSACLLKQYPINYTLLGGDTSKISPYLKLIDENQLNVNYLRWVDFEQLPELINSCDIGLGGPFGNTGQAQRVITGKTFQFLCMGKAVIVGENSCHVGFENKFNCIIAHQGDAFALSEAIKWAFLNREKLSYIGKNGRILYNSQYSTNHISQQLRIALRSI